MATSVIWYPGFAGPAGAEGWALLGDLRDARLVARSRTTRTESGILDLPAGPVAVHRKVYLYRGAGALLRGAFRTTFAAAGRARREAAALRTLGALGLAPPPVAVGEDRRGGFLRESRLCTATVPGGLPLDACPPGEELAAAAGAALGRLHAAGLGRCSAAPRNWIAARGPRGWTVVKVDSGGLRAVRRGGAAQAKDLDEMLAGLDWSAAPVRALRAAHAAAAGL